MRVWFLLAFAIDAAAQPTCAIHGVVLDQNSGAPVNRARVLAILDWLHPAYWTTTDQQGHYCFEKLEPGRYDLLVQRTGYRDERYGGEPAGPVNTLRVSPGNSPGPITIRISRRSVLSGRVVDRDGDPVFDAHVNVELQIPPDSWRNDFLTAQTDSRGTFRFFDLPPGKYFVYVNPGTTFWPDAFDGKGHRIVESQEVRTYYPSSLTKEKATFIVLTPDQSVTGLTIVMQLAAPPSSK
jgi:hypothetical protein